MKNKFISILLLFLSFFIFTACDGCSGCNNDKENDDKNNEVEAPNETPNELTDEIKTNAVNEIKEVVNGLKQNEYSLENWTNIQNLLVDYTVDIMSSKSISEVNNYVKNFKTVISYVEKLPIDEVNDELAVTDEVWGYIEESLRKQTDIKDFSFKYDTSFPSLGGEMDGYLEALDLVLSGTVNQTNDEYYFEFDNKIDTKLKVWICEDESSNVNVAFIDITSTDLTGKYVITVEDLFIYLLEDYLGITINPDINIPELGNDIDVEELLESLLSGIAPLDEGGENNLFDDYVNELLDLIKNSTESKMWVNGNETKVNVYVSKDKVNENIEGNDDFLTNDLSIDIFLVDNEITKIIIKPIPNEVEIPDDPDEVVDSTLNLSIIDRIQILFKNGKFSSGYIYTKVLNSDAAVGIRLSYDDLTLPSINRDEYESLDIEALIKENDFKRNSKKLVESYILYLGMTFVPGEAKTLEEVIAETTDKEFIDYLISHNTMMIYKTSNSLEYYVSTNTHLGKYNVLSMEIIEDRSIIDSLEIIEFNYLKVIEAYSMLQTE